jgi:membrane protein implicated in regulation of membrane protease activity
MEALLALGALGQIYAVAAAMGAIYVIGSFALGAVDTGGEGGDSVHADSHGVHAEGGDGIDVDVDMDGGSDAHQGHGKLLAPHHHALTADTPVKAQILFKGPASIVKMVMAIFSPLSFSIFMFFFGFTGLLTLLALPVLGPISLIPSLVVGVVVCNLVRGLIQVMAAKLESSSHARKDQALGQEAEVITPIQAGQTGEVVYKLGNQRVSSPAKAIAGDASFGRGSKVLITGMEGHLVLVEPWDELSLTSTSDPQT